MTLIIVFSSGIVFRDALKSRFLMTFLALCEISVSSSMNASDASVTVVVVVVAVAVVSL